MSYHTKCELLNIAGTTVKLDLSYFTGAQEAILDKQTAKFLQNPNFESWNGGVVYVLENEIKWLIVWNGCDQVYTRIFKREDTIIWVEIIASLNNSTNESNDTNQGYSSEAQINTSDGIPTVRATLKKATP